MLRLTVLVLCLEYFVHGYNILVVYPAPSYSHQLQAMALTEALVERGHHVFAVNPNKVTGLEENYTYVDISHTYKEFFNRLTGLDVFSEQLEYSKWVMIHVYSVVADSAADIFRSKTFLEFQQEVRRNGIRFDAIVAESFYLPYACAVRGLLGNSQAPIISLSTMTSGDYYGEGPVGNILHLSYVPYTLNSYTDKMNLWQRTENWASGLYISWKLRKIMEDAARTSLREIYGPDAETLIDGCWSNVSLAMITSSPLYFYPRMLPPNVIELGPLHIKPPEKLPQVLQSWLDGAEKGVVYFSLGSNVQSSKLHRDVLSNLLKVFRELSPSYRILWKWENETILEGQSDNVLAQKWFPQQSILAHPKVKAFVMQGGCQSFQETVHYAVPTIGIPWMSDQELNVVKMVDAGIGIRLSPAELFSYEKVKSAFETILFDKSYMTNIKRLSAISKDFTSQAKDKAVFWVEHIARHGGASHLRPATADTTLFQFLCWDIIAVLFILSLAILYIVSVLLKLFFSVILKKPNPKIKSH